MAAGTSYINLTLSNGSTMSVYISTSAAVGVIPNVSQIGTAGTTTPTEFQFTQDVFVTDQINVIGTSATVTAGEVEVYNINQGKRSQKYLKMLIAGFGVGDISRSVPRISFKAGTRYRFIVSTAQVSA